MKRIAAAAILTVISCLALLAQADRGTVSGTVTDSSGAVVPGVSLVLRNEATNLTYNATANENGTYSFLNLPIGVYILTADARGFQKYEVKGIQVQVNQQSRVDLSLRVGDVAETVQVQAE